MFTLNSYIAYAFFVILVNKKDVNINSVASLRNKKNLDWPKTFLCHPEFIQIILKSKILKTSSSNNFLLKQENVETESTSFHSK